MVLPFIAIGGISVILLAVLIQQLSVIVPVVVALASVAVSIVAARFLFVRRPLDVLPPLSETVSYIGLTATAGLALYRVGSALLAAAGVTVSLVVLVLIAAGLTFGFPVVVSAVVALFREVQ